jgi:hypothetical protein
VLTSLGNTFVASATGSGVSGVSGVSASGTYSYSGSAVSAAASGTATGVVSASSGVLTGKSRLLLVARASEHHQTPHTAHTAHTVRCTADGHTHTLRYWASHRHSHFRCRFRRGLRLGSQHDDDQPLPLSISRVHRQPNRPSRLQHNVPRVHGILQRGQRLGDRSGLFREQSDLWPDVRGLGRSVGKPKRLDESQPNVIYESTCGTAMWFDVTPRTFLFSLLSLQ